ncbi:uncharacterized protein B0P05DRAFT_239653 [Gilbertella persicaria]|uniref:uncharacterized protein n=1 Tax=Gilbertella persicaria TaxID=101096 RepID=UPI00221E84E4|nr:uncharacterized protein B0P05DRAFT_239653 [Gilbertella persicaria]KAI8063408.1 hypothetical protein B0P05DRAFT_239653 [Gilbertella persicaria]
MEASIPLDISHCTCASIRDHELGIAPCCSKDHWNYAIKQVRKSVMCTTAATISSPATHIVAYERTKREKDNQEMPTAKEMLGTNNYCFNSEFLSTRDIFDYRRSRSEHLMFRLTHSLTKKDLNRSCVRLSRGIFLVQQAGVSDTPDSSLSDFLDPYSLNTGPINIGTLTMDELCQDMIRQVTEQTTMKTTFTPFTYTLGVRYTNPYEHMHDVVIQGEIPLWCQTLFITEYMRQLPIQFNSVVYGLLPFAKDIGFRFVQLPYVDSYTKDKEPYPEMIVLFERFALELVDPNLLFEDTPMRGSSWQERKTEILRAILYCEIPDDQAKVITNLANAWASSQDFLL